MDEIVALVSAGLGGIEVAACAAGDGNRDDQITVDEIIAAVNAALGGCSASAYTAMRFAAQVVDGPNVPAPVTLDGALEVTFSGRISGSLAATFGATGRATLTATNGTLEILVGNGRFDLRPDATDVITLNGVDIAIEEALAAFAEDVNSGLTPERWSATSQALLALTSLTSTAEWTTNVIASLSGAGDARAARTTATDSYSIFCKASAVVVAATLGAGGVLYCATTSAACVAAAVGIPPLIAACPFIIASLCTAGDIVIGGPRAIYDGLLARWGSDPTPTATATNTLTPTATATSGTPTPTPTTDRTAGPTADVCGHSGLHCGDGLCCPDYERFSCAYPSSEDVAVHCASKGFTVNCDDDPTRACPTDTTCCMATFSPGGTSFPYCCTDQFVDHCTSGLCYIRANGQERYWGTCDGNQPSSCQETGSCVTFTDPVTRVQTKQCYYQVPIEIVGNACTINADCPPITGTCEPHGCSRSPSVIAPPSGCGHLGEFCCPADDPNGLCFQGTCTNIFPPSVPGFIGKCR